MGSPQHFVGRKASDWLHDFSWIALGVAVAMGVLSTFVLRRRAARALHDPAGASTTDKVIATTAAAALVPDQATPATDTPSPTPAD